MPNVTMSQIAEVVGVSQTTVSFVLNQRVRTNGSISEETRERVLTAAKQLGYQPNGVARALRRGCTDIIGVYTANSYDVDYGNSYDVRNKFLGTIVGALQFACQQYRLDVLLHQAMSASSPETMFAKLRDGRVDGLILHAHPADPLVKLLSASSLPVVAIADALDGLSSVICDDEGGMRQMVDLLWNRGYRRFVFLAPDMQLGSVERRYAGFEAELIKRGVAPADRRRIQIHHEKTEPVLSTLRALRGQGGPLAVCCWNDLTAFGLLKLCAENQVDVPGELAVTGFDGFQEHEMPARKLVTVHCPWEKVATNALDLLMEKVEHNRQGHEAGKAETKELSLATNLLDGDTA